MKGAKSAAHTHGVCINLSLMQSAESLLRNTQPQSWAPLKTAFPLQPLQDLPSLFSSLLFQSLPVLSTTSTLACPPLSHLSNAFIHSWVPCQWECNTGNLVVCNTTNRPKQNSLVTWPNTGEEAGWVGQAVSPTAPGQRGLEPHLPPALFLNHDPDQSPVRWAPTQGSRNGPQPTTDLNSASTFSHSKPDHVSTTVQSKHTHKNNKPSGD